MSAPRNPRRRGGRVPSHGLGQQVDRELNVRPGQRPPLTDDERAAATAALWRAEQDTEQPAPRPGSAPLRRFEQQMESALAAEGRRLVSLGGRGAGSGGRARTPASTAERMRRAQLREQEYVFPHASPAPGQGARYTQADEEALVGREWDAFWAAGGDGEEWTYERMLALDEHIVRRGGLRLQDIKRLPTVVYTGEPDAPPSAAPADAESSVADSLTAHATHSLQLQDPAIALVGPSRVLYLKCNVEGCPCGEFDNDDNPTSKKCDACAHHRSMHTRTEHHSAPPPPPPPPIADAEDERACAASGSEDTNALPARQSEGSTCSVCLEQFELNETLFELPCTHRFHQDCLRPWLQNHHTCPYCRHQLDRGREQQEEGSQDAPPPDEMPPQDPPEEMPAYPAYRGW